MVHASELSFQKKTIRVGAVSLLAEIADTPEKSAHGLMFRTTLPEGQGMLFIFKDEAPRSFWMKNTFVPLNIGFFDGQGKLIDLQEMQPVRSELEANPPSYQSAGPAKYALEVPTGWFHRHKIKLGAKLSGY